jgi:hypothetical protein
VSRADADIIMRALDPAAFAFRSAVQRAKPTRAAADGKPCRVRLWLM